MKKILSTLFLVSVISFVHEAEGAIAVVDVQNIAQQAKTYSEAVKMTTQQAQQITLQARELLSLPSNTLNSFTSSINNSIFTIHDAVNSVNGLYKTTINKDNINLYLNNKFFKLSEDKINDVINRENNRQMKEALSSDSSKYLEAYRKLLLELNVQNQKLQELLELNKSIEGNKQGQQIANQIAACQAQIQSIEIAMVALENQRKIEMEQANLTDGQNGSTLADAHANAVKNTVSKYKQETRKIMATNNNPFKRNRVTKW